jgi:hypothetical protein
VPRASVERPVEVEDERLLCKVQLDLAEQLRPQQLPQVERGQTALLNLLGSLRCLLACFTPPGRERVLLVDAVRVGAS